MKNHVLFRANLLALAALLASCTVEATTSLSSLPVAAQQSCKAPVLIGAIVDQTISFNPTELPDRRDLEQLTGLLHECGGEVGLGSVSSGDNFLIRARLPVPDETLREPRKDEFPDPFRYKQSYRIWQTAVQERKKVIADFLDAADSMLALPPANSSDVVSAWNRLRVLMNEDTSSWPTPPKRIGWLTTDGVHTASSDSGPLAPMPPEVTVVVTYGSEDTGILTGLYTKLFESASASVHYILAQGRVDA